MQRVGERVWRYAPGLFALGGAGLIGLAFAADALAVGGQSGFGAKQMVLVAMGAIGLVAGLVLALPATQRYLRTWQPAALWGRPATATILLAVWFGLLAGLLDVAWLLTQRYLRGRPIYQGVDFVWMAPLVDVLLFGLVGAALALAGRRWRPATALRAGLLAFTFLVALSVLIQFGWLHKLAALVLAAGLAKLLADAIARRPQTLYRLVELMLGWPGVFRAKRRATHPQPAAPAPGSSMTRRQFLMGAGVMLGGLALATRGQQAYAEYGRRTRLGPARPRLPNVLLIVMDTVRAQSLSLYGFHRPTTPNLQRLARQGVLFTRAFSTAPWTLPSHASMFTGRHYHELSTTLETPLDGTYPTLAEVLTAQGYQTAGFVANTEYCSREFGLSRGFTHYEDYRITPGQMIDTTSLGRTLVGQLNQARGTNDRPDRINAASINHRFLSWVAQRDSSRPYFAFLNYYDAHAPYRPPADFALAFGDRLPSGRLPVTGRYVASGDEIRVFNNAYDGAIAYLDHTIGGLVDWLERQGELANTFVVITSDHGEQFGEHRLLDHVNSLYSQLLHVPLLILGPAGIAARVSVARAVSLRDLPTTLLDLIGLPDAGAIPGKSLRRFWSGEAPSAAAAELPLLSEVEHGGGYPAWYPSMRGPLKSLVADGQHYIKNLGDGSEELYDIEADPREEIDLGATTTGLAALPRFRERLNELGLG